MQDTFWMAPMHGITHFPFRNCFLNYFADVDAVVAPFIPAQLFEEHSLSSKIDLFPQNNPLVRVVPQIMGTDAKKMVDTITFLSEELNYNHFNWNIGCPMKNIVKKNRGCGMMRFPEEVERVVDKVCSKTAAHFSVKMRLGMDSPEQGLDIIERLNAYPLQYIIIHPRLGTQRYEGTVDLSQFDYFYQQTKHSIIYSGDITTQICPTTSTLGKTGTFFNDLKLRYPNIHHWMIGRGMLWDPFVFSKLKNKEIGKEREIALFFQFYDALFNELSTLKEERTVLGIIKELWKYFSIFLSLDSELLKRVLRSQNYADLEEITTFIKKDRI